MKLSTAEIDAMVTAEVMAQVEEDAARFRWLISAGAFSFYECWLRVAWQLRGTPLGPAYKADFQTELRVEIDKRRARG